MSSLFQQLDHPFLSLALEAAKQSGKILRDSFRKEVSVQTKSLANFVSEVDLQSERLLGRIIREAYPTHEVLGEEGVNVSGESEQLWIVDPLDGTSNYLHGLPQFAVSIAYVEKGTHELGVVYNPILEDWFVAVKGQGAWYNGSPMRVSAEATLADTMVAVGFYYDRGRMMEATLSAIGDFFRQNVHGVRRFGAAALDLAQVARGDYGLFVEFKLHAWDHAAGGLMVQEAGGIVTDCSNSKLPLRGPSSILASNGLLHEAALNVASPHFKSSLRV
jgi:myo-inositol-1(or 4)-monophosphatase